MKIDTVFFGILLGSTFNGLRQYYEANESLLLSIKQEDLTKNHEDIYKLAKHSVLNNDEEYAEWSIRMQEHEAKYDMMHANFLRYSFLVLVLLVLENQLHGYCHALHDNNPLLRNPTNPKGNVIQKYKEYIEYAGVFINNALWEEVTELNDIRNCIVHSSGDASRVGPNRQEAILKIAKKGTGVQISLQHEKNDMVPLYFKDNMLLIEPKYCIGVLDNIALLFQALCTEADLPTKMHFDNNEIIFD